VDREPLAGNFHARLRERIDRHHLLAADVERLGAPGPHQAQDAVEALVDLEEGAHLPAVAPDFDRATRSAPQTRQRCAIDKIFSSCLPLQKAHEARSPSVELIPLRRNASSPRRRQGTGRITNIGWVPGFLAMPFGALYASTRHPIEGYSESLDHELRSTDIRCR
jgi:hypothetical protein